MSPASFELIAALLKARSGLVVGADKLYLLQSRLEPILRREGLPDLAALAARLRHPPEALVQSIVEAMATHESLFFRDMKPFEHLRREVLPALHAACPAGRKLRVWSAAASFGQEAYSLAMLLADGPRPAEVIGTDISHEAIARAKAGLYSQFEVQRGLPITMLMKHFRKEGDQWRVSEALRAAAQFRVLNLLDDLSPLGQFDVVFCRNVLIYFDPPTKSRVLDAIAQRLAPHGVPYLGAAETILGLTDRIMPYGPDRTAFRPASSARRAA